MKPLKVCKHGTGTLFLFIPKQAVLRLGLKEGQKLIPVLKKDGIFYRIRKEDGRIEDGIFCT
jgi:hypothetical protein